MPRRFESPPVSPEHLEPEAFDVWCLDPQIAAGLQERKAAENVLTRIMQVLDHVAERNRIEEAVVLTAELSHGSGEHVNPGLLGNVRRVAVEFDSKRLPSELTGKAE